MIDSGWQSLASTNKPPNHLQPSQRPEFRIRQPLRSLNTGHLPSPARRKAPSLLGPANRRTPFGRLFGTIGLNAARCVALTADKLLNRYARGCFP